MNSVHIVRYLDWDNEEWIILGAYENSENAMKALKELISNTQSFDIDDCDIADITPEKRIVEHTYIDEEGYTCVDFTAELTKWEVQ